MRKDISKFYQNILRMFKVILHGRRSTHTRLGKGYLDGNVEIGEFTYVNSGYRIVTGSKSKIIIGKFCAIGRNFSCASRTHSLRVPTADESHGVHERVEADIIIGNYVWIGENVFIKHGITVADYSVIGANSVVTKNVKPFEIVGGVPAKHIRFNTDHYKYSEMKVQLG